MKSGGNCMPRFFLFCGVLASIMMMVIIVVVGQITPDYNPISDTVSQLGTPDSPYAIVINSGYVIYGILICLAAYGLYRSISSTTTVKRLAILLGIHAIGTMLLGVFPDSLNLLPKHLTDDLLHNSISAVSYLPLLAGILIFRRIARQERTLRITGILGLVILIINLPMPVINMIDHLQLITGLLQRLLLGSLFFWLTLTFFLLYRKTAYSKKLGPNFAKNHSRRNQPQGRTYPTRIQIF
jgi:hypothetical membrane protein